MIFMVVGASLLCFSLLPVIVMTTALDGSHCYSVLRGLNVPPCSHPKP